MTKLSRSLICVGAFTALLCTQEQAHSIVLANYPFTSAATVDSTPTSAVIGTSTDTDLETTASAFTGGAAFVGQDAEMRNLTGFNATQGQSGTGTIFVRSTATPGTFASAFSSDSYFTFTLNISEGSQVDFTDVQFRVSQSTNGATANSPGYRASYSLRTSLDGFAAAPPSTGGVNNNQNQSSTSMDLLTWNLSGDLYQNVTGPVEFRIYVWDHDNVSTVFNRVDNVVLNGNVEAVPEPGSLVLTGAAIGFLLMRRRR